MNGRKKIVLSAAAVAVAVALAAAWFMLRPSTGSGDPGGTGEGEDGMKGRYAQISQEEAVRMMNKDDGHLIVDVRRQDEFDGGHIPGAVCIPNESIDGRTEALPDLKQILLVYCRSGRRSKEAAQKLADAGYKNVYEFGGILDWTGPVVTDVEIRFVNQVGEADVWILRDTEANRKTTLWGKADLAGSKAGAEATLTVERDGSGSFLFRAIGADHMYYRVDGVALENGSCLVFRRGGGPLDYELAVEDAAGNETALYPVPANKL